MKGKSVGEIASGWAQQTIQFLVSDLFWMQCAIIVGAFAASFIIGKLLVKHLLSSNSKEEGTSRIGLGIKRHASFYVVPTLFILALSISESLLEHYNQSGLVISIVQTISIMYVFHHLISNNIHNRFKRNIALFMILPISFLFFMGWLTSISEFLDGFRVSIGNISVSLNALGKTVIFGTLLYWLGKASNVKGQSIIRQQKGLDVRSKELFAKLFEICVFVLFVILMLEIVGVDYTTLAIFGGALGIGLGFGLQSIASNFISGIILLVDRSLSVGDHVELEDGQQGVVRVLNMRSATIETYDGKDVLVPNEKFISSSFINWTHQNNKQRYSIELQVAYDTDLHFLFDLIRSTVASHPQVFSGENFPIEEQPDAEILNFGDSGINILIEYWMDGIDDGKNRVGADLNLMLWDAFKANNIQIPFPQREIKMV